MKLIFATNNQHKLQEVREILNSRFSVLSLQDIGFYEDIDETATTLEGNSRLKAEAVWEFIQTTTFPPIPLPEGQGATSTILNSPPWEGRGEVCILADDTGLEISALNNAPGVYSARYAGEPSDPAKNRQKVLQEMANKDDRSARFRTVVTLIETRNVTPDTRDPKHEIIQLDGIVEGEILREERGEGGFGYDSIFRPKGYDCSFAEMSADQKNAISHRGRAMQKVSEYLKTLIISLFLLFNCQLSIVNCQLPMYSWQTHYAYSNVTEVEQAGNQLLYALSNGALFSVEDGEIRTYSKLTGLNGNRIVTMRYAASIHALLLFYEDGNIDFLYDNGNIFNLPDLKNKETNLSKLVQHCLIADKRAYLSMPFGVLVLNLQKREMADTYYIGEDAQTVSVTCTAIRQDTLFAQTETQILYALLSDNLVDYRNWHPLQTDIPDLFAETRINPATMNAYLPNGPAVNTAYDMSYADGYVYVVPGGRWAAQYQRPAHLMRYDGAIWQNLTQKQIVAQTGAPALDLLNVAIDPANAAHCFVTSYGTGLYEIQDMAVKHHYKAENSLMESVLPDYPNLYTRAAGACYDTYGNLWFLMGGKLTYNVLVLSPDGVMHGGNLKVPYGYLETPGKILQDRLRPNYKWVITHRAAAGLALIDDNGTPTNLHDDRAIYRTTFHHGNSLLSPEFIYCLAQDMDGTLWLGTTEGVYTFSKETDFFQSDACSRPTIVREDGSTAAGGASLADYLLQNEKVQAIAVDGANRKWIGTESAGVFLMSPDGTETIEHFTKENSPLPSDNILSICINDRTGEVFIGTSEGLLSYQSDAAASSEDLQDMYAYPNPVREDYDGAVTITGLIDGAAVRILNNAGQVVYSTTALGGLATWQPRNVPTGVYTVQCYDPENNLHGSTKVLILKR